MAEGGRILATVLQELRKEVRPGITTKALDRTAFDLIRGAGCKSAFLGYQPNGADKPYSATLCASVNDGVVHGLPSARLLEEGDVLKLDLGLIHKGWYLDSAITVPVGRVSKDIAMLIAATEEALTRGIEQAKAGATVGDIGYAVERYVKHKKFSVVEALTGHGIGHRLHEDPNVFNVGRPGRGIDLKEGMVIAIEPMVAMGSARVKQLPDDSFVTADGSLAAHFEHTIAITKSGPRILTKL